MRNDILVASKNRHKIVEISAILGPDLNYFSLLDFPSIPDIEETGSSLYENALIKAERLYYETTKPVIADDTGLFVSVLSGAPGIHSARFSGPNGGDADNRKLLLEKLRPYTDRNAYFETCLIYLDENGVQSFSGRLHGYISTEEKGSNGFGYDALFIPDGDNLTLAELSDIEKNHISHRYRALQKFSAWWQTYLSSRIKN